MRQWLPGAAGPRAPGKVGAVCSSHRPPRVHGPRPTCLRHSSVMFCSNLLPSSPSYFPNLFSFPSLPSTGAPSFLASLVLPLTSSSPFSYFLSSHLISSFSLPSSCLLSSHCITLPAPCQPVSDTQPRCLSRVCRVRQDGWRGACGLWRGAAVGWCWRSMVCPDLRSG